VVLCGVVWCCVVKSGDVWYAATHRQPTRTRLGARLYHGRPESAEGLAAVNGQVLGPVVHDTLYDDHLGRPGKDDDV
jgi:hypothetical protein